MLFFKRILNFTPDVMARKDKRENTRYVVGQAFPVKAVLNIMGRDGEGNIIGSPDRPGQDWGGWMLNLSSSGASMQLHPAALTARGELCRFKLSFEGNQLEIGARVAHFRAHPNYAVCGVSLEFPDAETHKAYLQLLEPVVVGGSFKPVDPKRIKQDTPDLTKEQYRGDSETRLTVWRASEGSTLAGFEMLIGPYSINGSNESPDLDVCASGAGENAAVMNAAAKDEVRRLFRWIVPNLAKAVPSDVRKFLGRF